MQNSMNAISVSYEDGKWKKKARQIAKEVLAANSLEVDKEGKFPEINFKAIAEQGLMAVGIPTALGGPGGSILSTNLIVEEFAQHCPSTAMCYLMHVSTLPLLSRLADSFQSDNFIKPIIDGKVLISYSQSEKGTGSRLWFMDSYAKDLGDHYEIDSFKSFATSSGHCNAYMLIVKCDEFADPNELSIFFVDGKDPKIKPIGKWDGMGLRGNSSTPVHFDHIKVEKERLFGQPDTGYNMLMAYTLPSYILGLSSVYLGISKRAYNAALEHVMKRTYTDNGDGLKDIETIQRYMAEMKMKIDSCKAYLDQTARITVEATKVFDQLLEAGLLSDLLKNAQDDEFLMQLAQVKVMCCELAREITDTAMQVYGGSGFKRGSIVEQCYRDARAGSLMGPADDILKVIIGKRVVGLPLPWNELKLDLKSKVNV